MKKILIFIAVVAIIMVVAGCESNQKIGRFMSLQNNEILFAHVQTEEEGNPFLQKGDTVTLCFLAKGGLKGTVVPSPFPSIKLERDTILNFHGLRARELYKRAIYDPLGQKIDAQ